MCFKISDYFYKKKDEDIFFTNPVFFRLKKVEGLILQSDDVFISFNGLSI